MSMGGREVITIIYKQYSWIFMHLGNKLKGGKINIKYNLSRKLFLCSSYCFNVHMSCGKIFQNTDDKKKKKCSVCKKHVC